MVGSTNAAEPPPFVMLNVDVELDESLLIAAQYNIYAYDAYLLRCAIKYRLPLLTLDRGLRHVAGQVGVQLVEVE